MSGTTREERLAQALEVACRAGCQSVRAEIQALSRGEVSASARDLDDTLRQRFLDELRSIMAVYDLREDGEQDDTC